MSLLTRILAVEFVHHLAFPPLPSRASPPVPLLLPHHSSFPLTAVAADGLSLVAQDKGEAQMATFFSSSPFFSLLMENAVTYPTHPQLRGISNSIAGSSAGGGIIEPTRVTIRLASAGWTLYTLSFIMLL